jgi:hypothetical protein
VWAQGRLSATGTKTFRIDHPDDPENKYLLHYCSEGPEPLNVYSGSVTTDAEGIAWVQLPDYFEEINKSPRYQLTVVDDAAGSEFVQVKVARRIKENRFMIMTSAPDIEVCWEVKAVRNDRWVRTYGAPVEVEKQDLEKGTYQHPELYGLPAGKGIDCRPDPIEQGEVMVRVSGHRAGQIELPRRGRSHAVPSCGTPACRSTFPCPAKKNPSGAASPQTVSVQRIST